MDWYFKAISDSFDYKTRAHRNEFLGFMGINLLTAFIVTFIDAFIGIDFVSSYYYILILIPMYSLSVRRLHDIGYDWKYSLLLFIPFVGLAFTIFLAIKKGQQQQNQYGSVPDEVCFY